VQFFHILLPAQRPVSFDLLASGLGDILYRFTPGDYLIPAGPVPQASPFFFVLTSFRKNGVFSRPFPWTFVRKAKVADLVCSCSFFFLSDHVFFVFCSGFLPMMVKRETPPLTQRTYLQVIRLLPEKMASLCLRGPPTHPPFPFSRSAPPEPILDRFLYLFSSLVWFLSPASFPGVCPLWRRSDALSGRGSGIHDPSFLPPISQADTSLTFPVCGV